MKRLASGDLVKISKKKPIFEIPEALHEYLVRYQRKEVFSLRYKDLLHFSEAIPFSDTKGSDTYWDTVIYDPDVRRDLDAELKQIYAYLKTDGDFTFLPHLNIERVDYCQFGNSKPFRIKVVNRYNDNHDYYYIKSADASRIYGLELEHILSPNRISFLVAGNTLIEEHIAGIPGDTFMKEHLPSENRKLVRIAKEFVKFNERCFAKLLGDMRSYNYVVVITQDFDTAQYRVRAIDFDQQSYEGNLKVYMPQFHKENQEVVDLVWRFLPPATIRQYQKEERSLMARRLESAKSRADELLDLMEYDSLSVNEKVAELRNSLVGFHKDQRFLLCDNMGQLTRMHLEKMLER